jgi:hypothetical protein
VVVWCGVNNVREYGIDEGGRDLSFVAVMK